jgi:branched-chain amino acid transport system permease protein
LVDPINLITTFASFFGIYAILTVSLNLEYGYAGQPNFGQVLFYGLGAFVAAIVTANLLPFLAGKVIGNICDAGAYSSRIAISSSFPVIAVSTWLFALIGAMFAGGIVGLLVSYPAIRVKEEWYLSMILLVAGEAFAIIVENTQQIGCGFNGVDGIQNPFYWIYSSYSSTSFSNTLIGLNFPGMIYAAIILGIAALCFLLSQRLVNSPYGRLLKSIRDDKVAAESLGKDVAKVRRQIMVIGSVMAGLAGGLYVFYDDSRRLRKQSRRYCRSFRYYPPEQGFGPSERAPSTHCDQFEPSDNHLPGLHFGIRHPHPPPGIQTAWAHPGISNRDKSIRSF